MAMGKATSCSASSSPCCARCCAPTTPSCDGAGTSSSARSPTRPWTMRPGASRGSGRTSPRPTARASRSASRRSKKKTRSKRFSSEPIRPCWKPGRAREGGGEVMTEKDDWRGEMLSRLRALIKEADPEVVEEMKWKKPSQPDGVPVWSHDGMICTGESYKNAVKLTFAKGASLEDPSGLFNASLEGNTRRAIDLHEGDEIDEEAFTELIRAAVALNSS